LPFLLFWICGRSFGTVVTFSLDAIHSRRRSSFPAFEIYGNRLRFNKSRGRNGPLDSSSDLDSGALSRRMIFIIDRGMHDWRGSPLWFFNSGLGRYWWWGTKCTFDLQRSHTILQTPSLVILSSASDANIPPALAEEDVCSVVPADGDDGGEGTLGFQAANTAGLGRTAGAWPGGGGADADFSNAAMLSGRDPGFAFGGVDEVSDIVQKTVVVVVAVVWSTNSAKKGPIPKIIYHYQKYTL
jgi:hypothetical protein